MQKMSKKCEEKKTKIEFFGTQIIDHNIVLDVSIVIPVVIEMYWRLMSRKLLWWVKFKITTSYHSTHLGYHDMLP